MGEWVTLYFCNGIVVRVEKGTGSGAKYGYLVNINGEGDFNDIKTQFMLVDNNALMSIYDMPKSIKIDGVPKKTYNEIAIALAQTDAIARDPYYDANYPYAQPVKYEINEKGQLSMLDTLKTTPAEANSETALKKHFVNGEFRMYNQNTSLYASNLLVASIASSTTRLRIPLNNREDADGYGVLTWGDGDSMKVTLCNVDEKIWIPEAVYGYEDVSDSAAISYRVRPVIVKEITTDVNADGDIVYTINVFSQKTTATYTAEENLVSGVENGDMIRVETTADNKVTKLELLYDASENKLVGGNAVSDSAGEWIDLSPNDSYGFSPFVMGYKIMHNMAIYVKDGFLRTTWSLPSHETFDATLTNRMDNINNSSAIYFRYSEVRGEPVVETASANDIKTYIVNPDNPSELIMVMYGNGLNIVYIIDK